MILFMKALKQSEKRLFSPFVQISRQFGGNRRGFSLANSAHVADVKVWSLFVISICWGKFALKITEKNNLACITSLVGCYIFKQIRFFSGSNTWKIIPHQVKEKLHCLHLFQIQLKSTSTSVWWAFFLHFKITNCAVLALIVSMITSTSR